MSPLYDSLVDVTEELFDKVIAVNLRGPFRLAVRFGERMQADRGGSIINVSSIAAVRPTPGELPYAMAKAGLNTLTVGLARALGPQVRVERDHGRAVPDRHRQRRGTRTSSSDRARTFPLRRGGRPDEIVGTAALPRRGREQLHHRRRHHRRRRQLVRVTPRAPPMRVAQLQRLDCVDRAQFVHRTRQHGPSREATRHHRTHEAPDQKR